MDKKSVLTVVGFAAALLMGVYSAMSYVHGALERDRDMLQRVLSEEFALFDTDGNKFMSRAELEVFARNTYQSMVQGDETPAQQSRTEFVALYQKNSHNGQNTEKQAQDAQATFNRSDMNGDDLLTEAEYATSYIHGLSKMGWPDFDGKGIALITGPSAPAAH